MRASYIKRKIHKKKVVCTLCLRLTCQNVAAKNRHLFSRQEKITAHKKKFVSILNNKKLDSQHIKLHLKSNDSCEHWKLASFTFLPRDNYNHIAGSRNVWEMVSSASASLPQKFSTTLFCIIFTSASWNCAGNGTKSPLVTRRCHD